jgi:hypothetical protein
MRILLTALIATFFLTGCPEDKKGTDTKSAGKDTATSKPAESAKPEKKEGEGEGW